MTDKSTINKVKPTNGKMKPTNGKMKTNTKKPTNNSKSKNNKVKTKKSQMKTKKSQMKTKKSQVKPKNSQMNPTNNNGKSTKSKTKSTTNNNGKSTKSKVKTTNNKVEPGVVYYKTKGGYYYKQTQNGGSSRVSEAEYMEGGVKKNKTYPSRTPYQIYKDKQEKEKKRKLQSLSREQKFKSFGDWLAHFDVKYGRTGKVKRAPTRSDRRRTRAAYKSIKRTERQLGKIVKQKHLNLTNYNDLVAYNGFEEERLVSPTTRTTNNKKNTSLTSAKKLRIGRNQRIHLPLNHYNLIKKREKINSIIKILKNNTLNDGEKVIQTEGILKKLNSDQKSGYGYIGNDNKERKIEFIKPIIVPKDFKVTKIEEFNTRTYKLQLEKKEKEIYFMLKRINAEILKIKTKIKAEAGAEDKNNIISPNGVRR